MHADQIGSAFGLLLSPQSASHQPQGDRLELSRRDPPTRTALVTGSSKGIGEAVAYQLADSGFFTFVTYRTDRVGGKRVVDKIRATGGAARLQYLDVRDELAVIRLMSTIQRVRGSLDVLVNNAGVDAPSSIDFGSFDEWKGIIDTKLHGCWLTVRHAQHLMMRSSNASVVVVASVDIDRPDPEYLAYSVANAGVIALVKALSLHLPRHGVRVNAIAPSEVRTPMWGADDYNNDELWQRLADANPMGRVATVGDVANAVMMLVNDPGRFLNGNVLYVDGGRHLAA
jgi:3-oxoacyl-[acyl-carrier protein] reductase